MPSAPITASAQYLGPAQGQGEQQGVAGRHVGDGNPFAGNLRDFDAAVGQGGVADGVQADVDGFVVRGAQAFCHPTRCLQLRAVALAEAGLENNNCREA